MRTYSTRSCAEMIAVMLTLTDSNLLRDTSYIGGNWLKPAVSSSLDVFNPATGDLVRTVSQAAREDATAAIDAAEDAFPEWSARTAKDRSILLRRWHDLIVDNVDDLAKILTAEQGKPLQEAKGEILFGAAFFEWFAEEAKRVYGETIPAPKPDQRLLVLRQPIGVCTAITPWNFPMAMIPRKAAPALAVGCTMVLKPASATPLSALALAELADRAGIPPGVFNVVPGRADTVGDELVINPIVRKVTFTGSTKVGRELMAKAAVDIKKVSLELGGNAPLVVFDDAYLDTAISGAIDSKFRNMGQTCVCANRIYVQSGIYDEFVNAFADAVRSLRVGNGLDEGVEQGPLIDEAAVLKTEEHVQDAVELGAKIVVGGSRHELGGTFFQPTVVANASAEMKVAREETFGPLAAIFRFDTEEEVIKLANQTEYGLAAYFFTRDNARIWRVSERLEFGIVGINTGVFSYEGAPFGGLKASGIGREGSHHGIDEFLEIKYLCVADLNR